MENVNSHLENNNGFWMETTNDVRYLWIDWEPTRDVLEVELLRKFAWLT